MSRVMTAGNGRPTLVKKNRGPKIRNNRRSRQGQTRFTVPAPSLKGLTSLGQALLAASAGILCMALLSAVLLFTYRWVTSHPYFALESVTVEGNHRLSDKSVLEMAGVSHGLNSLAVNIRAVEEKLSRSPWISQAKVKRDLPGSLSLSVTEKAPAYWVRQGEKLMYADASGMTIAPVTPEKLESLPYLEIEHVTDSTLDRLRDMSHSMHKPDFPFSQDQIGWMRVSGTRGLEVYLDGPSLLLRLETSDLSRGLDRAGAVLQDLSARGELSGVSALLVQDGRVWVRRRG